MSNKNLTLWRYTNMFIIIIIIIINHNQEIIMVIITQKRLQLAGDNTNVRYYCVLCFVSECKQFVFVKTAITDNIHVTALIHNVVKCRV